ncbi:hypothetical protein T484DRAFT_1753801 [Baffinella frigidus]|nr:hypothetical protein T484DRAFT_1753801 [Cryptophyta sp. CCMP2293]
MTLCNTPAVHTIPFLPRRSPQRHLIHTQYPHVELRPRHHRVRVGESNHARELPLLRGRSKVIQERTRHDPPPELRPPHDRALHAVAHISPPPALPHRSLEALPRGDRLPTVWGEARVLVRELGRDAHQQAASAVVVSTAIRHGNVGVHPLPRGVRQPGTAHRTALLAPRLAPFRTRTAGRTAAGGPFGGASHVRHPCTHNRIR